jgi:hypothetical protein
VHSAVMRACPASPVRHRPHCTGVGEEGHSARALAGLSELGLSSTALNVRLGTAKCCRLHGSYIYYCGRGFRVSLPACLPACLPAVAMIIIRSRHSHLARRRPSV